MTRDLAVVGLGQRERGDDGAGPAVIDRLRAGRASPLPGLKTWILRDDMTVLLDILESFSQVVIVDSVWTQKAPTGTIWSWRLESLPETVAVSHDSTHTLPIGATLDLARTLGLLTPCPGEGHRAPGRFFWGIEISGPPGLGGPLSEPVARAVDLVVGRIEDLRRLGI